MRIKNCRLGLLTNKTVRRCPWTGIGSFKKDKTKLKQGFCKSCKNRTCIRVEPRKEKKSLSKTKGLRPITNSMSRILNDNEIE